MDRESSDRTNAQVREEINDWGADCTRTDDSHPAQEWHDGRPEKNGEWGEKMRGERDGDDAGGKEEVPHA